MRLLPVGLSGAFKSPVLERPLARNPRPEFGRHRAGPDTVILLLSPLIAYRAVLKKAELRELTPPARAPYLTAYPTLTLRAQKGFRSFAGE